MISDSGLLSWATLYMDRILSEPVKITSREAPGLKRCAKITEKNGLVKIAVDRRLRSYSPFSQWFKLKSRGGDTV